MARYTRYISQGAVESVQDVEEPTNEPIDDLDNAFRPSLQPWTGTSTMDGTQEKNTRFSLEDDGELIKHDEAHGVFRSPRPSITLQELQELESRRRSAHGASGEARGSPSDMRGGIFGGCPLDDLWEAQEMDVGGNPELFAGCVALAEEAHKEWEEAWREKHNDTDWRDSEWRDETVFSESEAEDEESDELKTETTEEASSDDGWVFGA